MVRKLNKISRNEHVAFRSAYQVTFLQSKTRFSVSPRYMPIKDSIQDGSRRLIPDVTYFGLG